MKIKYDVLSVNEDYAIASFLVYVLAYMLFVSALVQLDHAHQLVAHSRMTNQTDFNVRIPICGIPYDELCCSVLKSTDPEISKHCVPDILLILSRIAVPVFMVMIAFILQLAFTIDGKHSRLLVRTLWTVYAFAFVIITYGVHHHSCFHSHTFEFLIIPGGLLHAIITYPIFERKDRRFPLHRNDNNSNHPPVEADDGSTESANNKLGVWKEIL